MKDEHEGTTSLPQVIGCCTVFGEFVSVGLHAHRGPASPDEEGRAALVAELVALRARGERESPTRGDARPLEATPVRR